MNAEEFRQMLYDDRLARDKAEENSNLPEWSVEVKGEAGSRDWEISVVRKGNSHGRSSWGWFDKNKILISHNGGPCHWPIPKYVFYENVRIAEEVCRKLNNGEILG